MAFTFLQYTNKVLNALNEVELTSSTFPTAIGFHAEAKNAVVTALYNFYTHQNIEWPFLWSSYTINTVVGQTEYTRNASAQQIDWDSFHIKRRQVSITSATASAGTATVTTSSPHLFVTGDNINIYGANETEYNGDFTIAVTGVSTFTYTITDSAATPATGTLVAKSNTVINKELTWLDYNNYRQQRQTLDANMNSTSFTSPDVVSEKSDGTIIISSPSNRVYEVAYEAFGIPAAPSAYDDTSLMPAAYDQVIIDRALHHAYMFRDNMEQAQLAQQRYMEGVNRMTRVYIPRAPNVRAVF